VLVVPLARRASDRALPGRRCASCPPDGLPISTIVRAFFPARSPPTATAASPWPARMPECSRRMVVAGSRWTRCWRLFRPSASMFRQRPDSPISDDCGRGRGPDCLGYQAGASAQQRRVCCMAGLSSIRETPVGTSERGPYCMMGICFDCLAEIDGMPNRQSCMVSRTARHAHTAASAGLAPSRWNDRRSRDHRAPDRPEWRPRRWPPSLASTQWLVDEQDAPRRADLPTDVERSPRELAARRRLSGRGARWRPLIARQHGALSACDQRCGTIDP